MHLKTMPNISIQANAVYASLPEHCSLICIVFLSLYLCLVQCKHICVDLEWLFVVRIWFAVSLLSKRWPQQMRKIIILRCVHLIIRRAVASICKLPTTPKCIGRKPYKKIIQPWSSWLGNITLLRWHCCTRYLLWTKLSFRVNKLHLPTRFRNIQTLQTSLRSDLGLHWLIEHNRFVWLLEALENSRNVRDKKNHRAETFLVKRSNKPTYS